MQQIGRRNDPNIKKMLIVVYILYYLGLIESILLFTNGVVMVLGFALVLFQSNPIKESSYVRHYWWLITLAIIFLLLIFASLNFTSNIKTGNISFTFYLRCVGQLVYFILLSYGFFCLLKNKQLPNLFFSKKNKNLPSKK
ncbi:MAG: hypothetical protein GKC53_00870 [Neisseriaceae bacterium]|nr:MAG: hypothetical protein GKC53_00870 [Neisseriaceae bacterium]